MSYLKNFYYQIYGKSTQPKMVFLHGLMGMGSNWRKVISAFENDYEILTYDQRGHGRSFQPETGFGPFDYAEDLYKILEELNWGKVNLIGHSMGGRAAIAFAIRYPERLNKLVIEDIPPKSTWDGAEKILKLIESVPAPFKDRVGARDFFKSEFLKGAEDPISRKRLGDFFYLNLIEDKVKGHMDWRFSKKAIIDSLKESRNISLWEDFSKIERPILIVKGEISTDLTLEDYHKMLELNNHSKGVIVEESGHWIHAEKPKKFSQILNDFLNN